MAFVNEKIPEQDRAAFEAVINYENLKKLARYIPEFRPDLHLWWTIDRKRGAYVLAVTGGGESNWTIMPLSLRISQSCLMLSVREKAMTA